MDRRDRELLNTQISRFQPAPRRDGVLILGMVGVFIAGLAAGGLLFKHFEPYETGGPSRVLSAGRGQFIGE